jgi:hypothetical protein
VKNPTKTKKKKKPNILLNKYWIIKLKKHELKYKQ